MKYFILSLSIGIILVSCKKNNNVKNIPVVKTDSIKTQHITAKKEFVVDSVRVQDSLVIDKNLTTSFDKKLLVFPSITNKALLDSIYKIANVHSQTYDAKTLLSELTKEMKKGFAETKESAKEWPLDFKQNWNDDFDMQVVSHNDDILTLLYSGSGYSGGAHGYYFESYKVFDLKKNKVINQNDIFKNPTDAAWNKIFNDNFKDKDQREMLLVDKIMPNNNFYFDDKEITFVYNQYEITAYAAGVVYITIKFSKIKNYLKPEFIKEFKVK